MGSLSKVRIIITLNKPHLDDQELERETEEFYEEMLKVNGLEQVKRIRDTTPLEGEKGGRHLPGLLEAKVEEDNLENVRREVSERSGKKANTTIVKDTEKIPVEGHNRSSEDLSEAVEKAAQKLLAS
ncbi:hypothetical protein [Aerosakkonema funiforme]|uniref:hypothetical protein n=1 Tax=Aerosakkonema funiforme TaxID=1246630 RepID=UPI0035BB9BA2